MQKGTHELQSRTVIILTVPRRTVNIYDGNAVKGVVKGFIKKDNILVHVVFRTTILLPS